MTNTRKQVLHDYRLNSSRQVMVPERVGQIRPEQLH
jgi:hypothetical protein